MPRLFCFILLICFISPLTVYSASPDNVLIEKQKLICMYEQIDDLLDEPDDSLVMVILTKQCAESGSIANDGMITRSLPRLNMRTSSTPGNASETIGPDDILMLTHPQLECFKQNYKDLLVDERNPLPVNFGNSCD